VTQTETNMAVHEQVQTCVYFMISLYHSVKIWSLLLFQIVTRLEIQFVRVS